MAELGVILNVVIKHQQSYRIGSRELGRQVMVDKQPHLQPHEPVPLCVGLAAPGRSVTWNGLCARW